MVEFDTNGITDEHYVGVDGNNNPITADSLFIWGSVSKSFTGALALELANKRLIDLNAPVTRYYPEFQGTAFGNNGATITDLIHHTSGLPREVDVYPAELPKIIDTVRKLETVNTTDGSSYSNVGYILLQHAMERATGQSYSELLTHYLNPATGISPISSKKEALERHVPDGYVPFYAGKRTVTVPYDDSETGKGRLTGTGRELATYGAWQLRQHQQGQLPSNFSRAPIGKGSSEYGAGLRYRKGTSSIDGSEVTIVAHTGNIWGYTTYLGFNQTTGKGLMVLLNTYGLRDRENTNIANKLEKFTGEALGIEAPANLPTNVPRGDIIIWTQVALIVILLNRHCIHPTHMGTTPSTVAYATPHYHHHCQCSDPGTWHDNRNHDRHTYSDWLSLEYDLFKYARRYPELLGASCGNSHPRADHQRPPNRPGGETT